jgi:hypothetical protein
VDRPRYPRRMAILVDPAIWPWRGRVWAHLVSDQSHDELHHFAARLGIPRRAFQGDHYDIPAELRLTAVELGALEVDARVLVSRLRAAGLRRRPRSTPARVACG